MCYSPHTPEYLQRELLTKCLLSTYYVPRTVLGARDTTEFLLLSSLCLDR